MRSIRLVLAHFVLVVPFLRAHDYLVRSEVVVDNEIRLIVETMKISGGFIVGHSLNASHAKTWLVVIPIHSKSAEAPESRPYVVGPLWEVDAKRSAMSAQEHIDFTKSDRMASMAEPFVGFGDEGEVLRIQWETNSELGIISRLVWTRKAARWVPAGNQVSPKGVGEFNRVQVGSRALTLAWPNPGKPILFETMTGKEIDDPWLTQTFLACAGSKWIDYATYGFLNITDDRKYIVTFPSEYLNPDGSKWVYNEAGPWPTRKAPATYYERGGSSGTSFEQHHVKHGFPWDSGPTCAVTVDGELRVFNWTPEFFYLEAVRTGESIKVANPGLTWNNLIRTIHQDSRHRLFFFDEGFDSRGGKYFAAVEWDYGANRASRSLIDLESILHIEWGAPMPERQVKIKE